MPKDPIVHFIPRVFGFKLHPTAECYVSCQSKIISNPTVDSENEEEFNDDSLQTLVKVSNELHATNGNEVSFSQTSDIAKCDTPLDYPKKRKLNDVWLLVNILYGLSICK